VRKSRARIGVRTECKDRKMGKGECHKRVNRKWLCRGGGRLLDRLLEIGMYAYTKRGGATLLICDEVGLERIEDQIGHGLSLS